MSFICNFCKRGAAKLHMVIQKVSIRQEKIEENVQRIDDSTKELKAELGATKTLYDTRIADLEKRLEEAERKSKSTVADAVMEIEERKERKDNYVVYGMPESKSDDVEVRKREDAEAVTKLLRHFNCGDALFDRVIRFGKQGQFRNKTRPMRLTLKRGPGYESSRRSFNELSKALRSNNSDVYKTVEVKPDQTPFHRDQMRFLWKEKEEKQAQSNRKGEAAEWTINWKKMRIVNRARPTEQGSK